jgi:hypothetical protein
MPFVIVAVVNEGRVYGRKVMHVFPDERSHHAMAVPSSRKLWDALREQLAKETARSDSAESAQYALSAQLGHAETARTKAEMEITALRVRLTKARAEALE